METTRVVPRGSKNTSVLGKIYSECKIFSSIIFILDKLESDGYFERINECLQFIFNKEMAFAVFELKKIKSRKKKFDIKNQLVNNTFIFKENLKIITGSLIDTLWNEKVRTERIQQTIQKAQQEINKGTFEEIIELGEEEENYFSSDAPAPKDLDKKRRPPPEDDFPHSYDTDLASKDFRFGSGEAEGKVGAGEDKSREVQEVSDKSQPECARKRGSIKLHKKDAREFGTFGEVEKPPRRADWDNQFEIEVEESIDKQIQRAEGKDVKACQSMGNKWDIRGWEAQSNGEKPRTSASMGSLTLKSNQKITSSEKHQSGTTPKDRSPNDKGNWKRSSGLNMYLLSRKHGSSQGSSMRSVSKSGSLRQDNSSGAKSESLKRKREHKNWLHEEVRRRPIPKRTLADRLSGQKQRKIRNGSSQKQAKTYCVDMSSSMTPDLDTKKRGSRVSSLTKLKRLKNNLLRNPQKGSKNSLNQETGSKRGRKAKSRSPHQILNTLGDYERSPKVESRKAVGVGRRGERPE